LKSESVRLFFWAIFLPLASTTAAEGSVILRPSLSLTEAYTDNFFFTLHDKKGELITTLSPEITITQRNSDIILAGRYAGGIIRHLNYSAGNGYRQGLALDMDLPFLSRSFKGLAVHLAERAEQAESRYTTPRGPTGPALFATERGRIDTFNNLASIRIDSRWSQEWFSTLTYNNTNIQYKGGLLEDVITHDAGLSSRYSMHHGRTNFTLSYNIFNANFEMARSAKATQIAFGGTQAITPTASFYGGIGESWVKDGPTKLITHIGALKRDQLALLGIDYFRGVETGDGVIAAAILHQGLSAKATRPITVKTVVTAGLDYGHQRSLSGPDAETFSRGLTASITTRLSPLLSWTLQYAYLDDEGRGVAVENVKRNQVSFTLYATPAGWQR